MTGDTRAPVDGLARQLHYAIDPIGGFARGVGDIRGGKRELPVTVAEIKLVDKLLKDAAEALTAARQRIASLETALAACKNGGSLPEKAG